MHFYIELKRLTAAVCFNSMCDEHASVVAWRATRIVHTWAAHIGNCDIKLNLIGVSYVLFISHSIEPRNGFADKDHISCIKTILLDAANRSHLISVMGAEQRI